MCPPADQILIADSDFKLKKLVESDMEKA